MFVRLFIICLLLAYLVTSLCVPPAYFCGFMNMIMYAHKLVVVHIDFKNFFFLLLKLIIPELLLIQ